jgi:hypothetical protein
VELETELYVKKGKKNKKICIRRQKANTKTSVSVSGYNEDLHANAAPI